MNQDKIGKFILKLRMEKNMTQKELADLLHVSDRAVSHWEHGRSLPDVSLFLPLCKLFNISVNELISGERIDNSEIIEKSENNLLSIMNNYKKKKRIDSIIITLIIVVLLFTSLIGLINSRPLIINYAELNELDDVVMRITNITKTSARVLINDYSTNKYIYGTPYYIERKVDGKWIKLEEKNRMIFTSKAYYPDSKGTLEFDVNWGYGYGELDNGYYRIVKCVIKRGDKKCIHYYFSAEFEIK